MMKMLTKDPAKRVTWKDLFEKELNGIDPSSTFTSKEPRNIQARVPADPNVERAGYELPKKQRV
jgi:hypothetical protein